MLLYVQQEGTVLLMRLSVSCKEPLNGLCERFVGLTAEKDEDGLWHLTWTAEEENI